MNFIRFNPEFLVFKGISRQGNSLNRIGCMQFCPIDIYAQSPSLAEGLERAAKIGDGFARMRKRLECLCRWAALLPSQRGECVPWPDFNKNLVGLAKSSARQSENRTVWRMWRAQYAGSVASLGL